MTFGRPSSGDREIRVRNTIDDRMVVGDEGLPLENRAFYLTFLEDYSTIVVSDMRDYFSGNPRTVNYRWFGVTGSDDKQETAPESKIHIAVETPGVPRKWPSVLLTDVSGDIQDLWLAQKMGTLVIDNPNYDAADLAAAELEGEDYLEEPQLEVGERLGGHLKFSVTLSVRALTKPECDRVTDLVIHGLVGPLRQIWYRRALNWYPESFRVSPVQEEAVSDSNVDKVFKRTMTFALQGEWYDDFFYQALTVNDVTLGTITKQGPSTL